MSSICSACEEYAASSSSDPKLPLCGNCMLLGPKDLAATIEGRKVKDQIKAGQDPAKLMASLQSENVRLTAENEAQKTQIELLKTLNKGSQK